MMTPHLNFKFRVQTCTVLISSKVTFLLLSRKTQKYSVKNQLPSEKEENLWKIFSKSRKESFPASASFKEENTCRVTQKFYTAAKT